METYVKLEEMLNREIDKIAKEGNLTANTLNNLHMLTATLKNVLKVEMLEDAGEYSQDGGYWEAEGSYDRGRSNARRGQHYVRGHYSRDDYSMRDNSRGNSRAEYSRTGNSNRRSYSYDEGKNYIVGELENMMNEAETEKEREALRKCMQSFER